MINVLLLREPSEEVPDRYEAAFLEAGYHPLSIPVLETVHANIGNLKSTIQDGVKAKGISGVVITSKRSCDAWREALQRLRDNALAGKNKEVASWCSVPFYVVGEATETALRATFAAFKDLGLTSVDVRGQSSGNAAILGPFILNDQQERPKKLLYLTGDKNRDTLPSVLKEGGISLESLQVYITQGSSLFESTLDSALKSDTTGSEFWWIVYFAPSAASFVAPILRKYFDFQDPSSTLRPCKVAAIGPSTNAFLHDDLGIQVDALAQKPTPDGIVSAITIADRGTQTLLSWSRRA